MKITIDGKEYECKKVVMDNNNVEIVLEEDSKKETGYERAYTGNNYYSVSGNSCITQFVERDSDFDDEWYDKGNYYSSNKIAQNNARADKLLRQLRQFSILNRKNSIDWKNKNQRKFVIYYDYGGKELKIDNYFYLRMPNLVYFDSRELATKVIEKFKDELIWYFTEYKDSL